MNLGFIIYGYPPEVIGGAELQAQKLAKLLSNNHRVTIFAGSLNENNVTEMSPNLKVIKIKWRDIRIWRLFLSQLFPFLRQIKKEINHIDLFVCYQTNPAGMIGLFSKYLYGKQFIYWIRAETEYRNWIRKYFFTPFLILNANRILLQSERNKKDMFKSYSNLFNKYPRLGDKIHVIPNGVIIPQEININKFSERSGVIYIGRLHKNKGVKYLIGAMTHPSITESLLIVGDGAEKEKLRKLAMKENVKFLSWIEHDEIYQTLSKAKVLVLPSIMGDGVPNVILEAMAVGTPVIATKIAGIPEIIDHGNTGFLVDPKDSKQIAYYINKLLIDSHLWERMSTNCLNEVVKYSWDNIIEKFENLLIEIE